MPPQALGDHAFDRRADCPERRRPGAGQHCHRHNLLEKVAPESWHLCGALPGPGALIYEGAGTHELTVFTTGPDVKLGPAGPNPICAGDWQDLGIKQMQCRLKPGERGQLKNVSTGDLVYVARRDRVLSDRTIGVLFLDVPGDLGDAPSTSDSRIRIELNSTTGDAGVRASVDGEGESLSSVRIVGPNQRIFQASGGNLGQLGLAELAFETHAPALEELLALFPEGEYRLQGRTVEGDKILHTASLTHDIPDGPAILTPEEGAVVDPEDAVISWDPVTEPAGIEIAGYRVIVERGDRGRTLSLEVPAETTNVLVPPDFLELGPTTCSRSWRSKLAATRRSRRARSIPLRPATSVPTPSRWTASA